MFLISVSMFVNLWKHCCRNIMLPITFPCLSISRNIVAETCFPSMFPCLFTSGKTVMLQKHHFSYPCFPVCPLCETLPRKRICFLSMFPSLSTSGNIAKTLCFLSMFHSLSTSGNIVAETSCFLSMFTYLFTSGNIVNETKCASYRKFICFPTMEFIEL